MSERVPVRIDPLRMADRGGTISGMLPVSACQRLREWLASDTGSLTVALQFGRDEQHRRIVTGQIDGQVKLTCQRCLRDYDMAIDRPIGAVLVEQETEAAHLPDEIDAIAVGEARTLHTVDLIEDDLILALPLIPKCTDQAKCVPAVDLLDSEHLQASDPGGEAPTSKSPGTEQSGTDGYEAGATPTDSNDTATHRPFSGLGNAWPGSQASDDGDDNDD